MDLDLDPWILVHYLMDPDPALFVSGFQDANISFTSVFKDNKSKRSLKTVEIRFSQFFAC
jgi:hypothetical protein